MIKNILSRMKKANNVPIENKSPEQSLGFRAKTIKEAVERYGEIKNNTWDQEKQWMIVFKVDDDISKHLINSVNQKQCKYIYINKDLEKPLKAAFDNIKKRGLAHELKTFDGCFNIRDVRGQPGVLSCHAYGLAIDINASENKLGEEPKISKELVKCFTDAGFSWGGNFKRKDGMHFSFAWE